MVSGGRKLQSADRQMSEAFITSVFLAMSGGFQDAYTYFTRDEVFSNAQTGNVVLMSHNFMTGQWGDGLRYLFPVLAFAISRVALVISSTDLSLKLDSLLPFSNFNTLKITFFLPNSSRALLSSG